MSMGKQGGARRSFFRSEICVLKSTRINKKIEPFLPFFIFGKF
jgi:hypothetical protein